MKKKLEAELISIAHRILKLKNKSELAQLHHEAQKLYETLSVLRFVETNFSDVKPTIGHAEIESIMTEVFDRDDQGEEPEIIATEPEKTSEVKDDNPTVEELLEEEPIETQSIEPKLEESKEKTTNQEEEVAESTEEKESIFKPAFELSFDNKEEQVEEQAEGPLVEEIKTTSPQISFDDLLGADYMDPVFVKPEDLAKENESNSKNTGAQNVIPIGRNYNDNAQVISLNKDSDLRTVSLNDRLSKGIIIGLNDRVAFMKNLFANSSEDYNRVLSQLMTFDTFSEAQSFIDTMVKPDYNNWEGKDEYAVRFMEIVEKKFS